MSSVKQLKSVLFNRSRLNLARRVEIKSSATPRPRRLILQPLEDRRLLDAASVLESALLAFQGPDLTGKDGPMASVGFELTRLYYEWQEYKETGDTTPFSPSNSLICLDGDRVLVDINAGSRDVMEVLASLKAVGMEVTGSWGSYISGFLPIDALDEVAAISGMGSVSASMALSNGGLTTTQGDIAQGSNLARSVFGVDGSGITVGVLSDSFDALGGAATDVATGDLPPGVVVLQDYYDLADYNEYPAPTDEGRALMQVIHDVAPGADLMFHTAYGGIANFAQGIVDLANAGCDIIVDDVIYFAEPMFQDGLIAQAVDQVVGMGVAYFSAAGNEGRESYEDMFRDSGMALQVGYGGNLHDFDPSPGVDAFQQVSIPPYGSAAIVLQWDEPYSGSSSDIDIYLLDAPSPTANILAWGVDANIGGDPVEVFGYFNASNSWQTAYLAITRFWGTTPGTIKYVVFGDISIDEWHTYSGTSYGHPNAAGAMAVGAAFYDETPAFGTSPPVVEYFSSAGGVPILFDTMGNRLASPIIRQTPDITAPDGGNTTFFGFDISDPGDGSDMDTYPNFFGTSASAPHAAGVAALMLEAAGGPSWLAPWELYNVLTTTAIDMDDPATPDFDFGYDFGTGWGLVDAYAAVGNVVANVFPGLGGGAPTADANGPYVISEGQDLVLDASGSTAGPYALYEWDVDGDGEFDEGVVGETVTLSWAELQDLGLGDGPYVGDVTLRVTDYSDGMPPGLTAEQEPNDTLETAQNLDAAPWTLAFNPDIGDTSSNTSTSIPHITVMGTGDGTYDYYSFTVPEAGVRGIFDIDYATFDTYIRLYREDGTLVAYNDDSDLGYGQAGSTSYFDSYLEYIFPAAGQYIIKVSEYYNGPVPLGGTYRLQISLEDHPLGSPIPGSGGIDNGGFETGSLLGWSVGGSASVVTSSFGTGPVEGMYQALLTTGNGAISQTFLESLLGLAAGTLDGLGAGDATEGSVIFKDFEAEAGDVVSFQWNFLTNEYTPSEAYNDFAFVSITATSVLADTFSDFVSSLSPYNEETGFQTFSYTVPVSGTYRLGIGVVDVGDTIVDSALLVDDVRLPTWDIGTLLVDTDTTTLTINNVPPTVTPPSDQSATEGMSAALFLGSFSDPGDDGPWAVTIDWGDSTTTSFLTSIPGSLGNWPHTYADDGTYLVTVTVAEDNGVGPSGSATFQVNVANAPPVLSNLLLTPLVNEGDYATLTGNIADSGVSDTFVMTVDWGDGTVDTYFYPAGTTSFIESHRYLDDDPSGTPADTYTVVVTLADSDGAISSFIIPNGSFETGDFNAWTIVDNGSNVGESASVVVGGTDGTYSARLVMPEHSAGGAYRTEYTDTLRSPVFAASEGATIRFDWRVVETGDDPYVRAQLFDASTGTPVHTFLDQTFATTTDWTTVSWTVQSPGTYYLEFQGGSYDATGGWWIGADLYIDNVRLEGAASVQTLVQNVAPDFEAGPDAQLEPADAGILSRIIAFTDPGNDSWTGTVNYGDGTGDQSLTIDQAAKQFDLTHTYTSSGTFTVSVTISDDDGGTKTDTFQVEVNLGNRLTGIDVQKGAIQRSYVRYVDLIFENALGLDTLVTESRIRLTRFNLDGSGGTQVDLAGRLRAINNRIEFDFGPEGIGGNRNSNAGDGYYEIGLDLDGNGTFETTRYFYRLLGDVNGDRMVDTLDAYAILFAYGRSGPGLEEDANGDGFVNSVDRVLTIRSIGRALDAALAIDD